MGKWDNIAMTQATIKDLNKIIVLSRKHNIHCSDEIQYRNALKKTSGINKNNNV